MGRYRKLGALFNRTFRNDYNANVDDIEKDIDKFLADGVSTKHLAEQAIYISETAKMKSENVQEQFNQVVIGGDSSVEAAQARVDVGGKTFTTLKDRLDNQLADLSINPKNFKIASDPDDTDSILRALQFGVNNGYRKISLPRNTYRFRKPLYLNGLNDIIIDLNNSTIEWNGSDNTLPDRNDYDVGVFSVHGSTNQTKYFITAWEKEVTRNTDITPEANHTGNTLKCSKVTLSDASSFSTGDYIIFQIGDPIASGNADYTNVYKPTISVLTRIIEKVSNDLYIDYYSPYDWSQVDITTGFVQKANPIKNVQIKNLEIKDITPYNAPAGITGDNPNRLKLVSGIGLRYAVDFKVENLRGLNLKLNLITGKHCYKGNISNLDNKYPKSHGGGEGYGIQMINSMKIHVEYLESNDGNSALDFSGCAFCSGRYIVTTNNIGGKTIGTHGMAEHDLLFEDCVGEFGFNNGSEYFACMSINITLNRCKGNIHSPIDSFTEIKIINSEIFVEESTYLYFSECELINSTLFVNPFSLIYGHKRGIAKKSNFRSINSKIIALKSTSYLKFLDFEELSISGGVVDFTATTANNNVSYEDCVNVTIASRLKNAQLQPMFKSNKTSRASLIISDCIADLEQGRDGFVVLDNIKNVILLINLTGNIFNYRGTSIIPHANLTYAGSSNFSNKSNTDILINSSANVFYANNTGALIVRNSDYNDDPSLTYIRYSTNGDVIKGGSTFAGSGVNSSTVYPYTTGIASSKPPKLGSLMVNPSNGRTWIAQGTSASSEWREIMGVLSGTTALRPSSKNIGAVYFDTSLGKPVFWNGTSWVDSSGAVV